MADFLDKMDKIESTTSRGRKVAAGDSGDDDDDDENENDEDIDLFRDPDDVCVGLAVWYGFETFSFRVSSGIFSVLLLPPCTVTPNCCVYAIVQVRFKVIHMRGCRIQGLFVPLLAYQACSMVQPSCFHRLDLMNIYPSQKA